MLMGKRIQLRAIEEDDLPLIAKWRSDPSVYQHFYEYEPLSLRQQRAWYERQLADKTEKNFVVATIDGQAIGTASVVHIDMRNRNAEYGRLLIGDEIHRKSGIGSEIELLIMEYAFDHLNLNKLYLEVLDVNASVIELHEGFGFRKEGLLRCHVYKAGEYVDVVVMAMLKEAYDQSKKSGIVAKLRKRMLPDIGATEKSADADR